MDMINHKYRPTFFWAFFRFLFNFSAFISLALFLMYVIVMIIDPEITFSLSKAIGTFLYFLLFIIVFGITGNYLSDIDSDDVGLHVHYLWMKLTVHWDEITDYKPAYNWKILKQIMVVRTKSLTPFHRLYGLLYSFSIAPCLIIHRGISHYPSLEQRIIQNLKKNRFH